MLYILCIQYQTCISVNPQNQYEPGSDLFGFLLSVHDLHFGEPGRRAEKESESGGKNESDKDREGVKEHWKEGEKTSVTICLCANSWLL